MELLPVDPPGLPLRGIPMLFPFGRPEADIPGLPLLLLTLGRPEALELGRPTLGEPPMRLPPEFPDGLPALPIEGLPALPPEGLPELP